MQTLPFAPGACAGIVAFYSMIYAADPNPPSASSGASSSAARRC